MATGEEDIPPKLVKYKADPVERAALIPAAIDYWNNEIHYWDRKSKNAKMKDTAYAFYRGTAPLYWYDFGQDERLAKFGNEHSLTWLSGDYHAYNAGSSSHEAQVVYGLNDFDESVVADYQLDLWRLAISIVLIARENENLNDEELVEVLNAMSAKYLERMRAFVSNKAAIEEKLTKQNAYGKLQDFLEIIEDKYNRDKMLDKWCPQGPDGIRQFNLSLPKLGSATAQERQDIRDSMAQYWTTTTLDQALTSSNFEVLDISRRLLAGTGSLGCDRFYLLVRDKEAGVDRILDAKEQPKPAPYPYMGRRAQELYNDRIKTNDADAVVMATRAMSVNPDGFAGWMQLPKGYYSVQERSPFKGSYPALLVDAKGKFKKLKLDSTKRYRKLAEQWAWVLASHHAYAKRDYHTRLEKTIANIVGDRDDEFNELVQTIAFVYADQVERDWKAFRAGLGADMVADQEE